MHDNVAYRATLFLLRIGAIGPVTGEPVEVYVPFETVSEGYQAQMICVLLCKVSHHASFIDGVCVRASKVD